MSGWQALDQFLRTDPRDVGCEQAMEMLDIYVDFAGLLAAVTGTVSWRART